MATIKELVISVKTKFDASSLKVSVDNIKTQFKSIKDPVVKPIVDSSKIKASIASIKNSYKSGLSEMQTIGVGLSLVEITKQAVEFDKALMGVKKQVADVVDDAGKFTPLGNSIVTDIRNIAKESGISASVIASIYEEGGKAGVQGQQDLKKYAMQVVQLKAAFDLTQESLPEFTRKIGQYRAAMGLSVDQTGEFTDQLNYLDDQIANVSGENLLDFAMRTSSIVKNANFSREFQLAFGAIGESIGQVPEVLATSFNNIIPKLQTAKATFKKNDPFLAIGMNAAQVQEGMVKNADQTMINILTNANKLTGSKRAEFFNAMAGTEHQTKFAAMAAHVGELGDAITKANSDMAKNSAQKEYVKIQQSVSGQLDTLLTNLKDISLSIGQAVLPALLSLTSALTPIIQAVGEFAKNNQWLVQSILAVLGVAVGFKVGAIALTAIVGGLGTGISVLTTIVTAIISPISTLVKVFNLLKIAMATNPIGVLIVGLTTLAGVIYMVYENWDSFVSFFSKTWDKIKAGFETVKEFMGFGGVEVNNTQTNVVNKIPQQAQQQLLTNNNTRSSTINDNKTININVASNGSATQGKDISNIVQQQNRNNFAYASGGLR